jgi:hypothetical protein
MKHCCSEWYRYYKVLPSNLFNTKWPDFVIRFGWVLQLEVASRWQFLCGKCTRPLNNLETSQFGKGLVELFADALVFFLFCQQFV